MPLTQLCTCCPAYRALLPPSCSQRTPPNCSVWESEKRGARLLTCTPSPLSTGLPESPGQLSKGPQLPALQGKPPCRPTHL